MKDLTILFWQHAADYNLTKKESLNGSHLNKENCSSLKELYKYLVNLRVIKLRMNNYTILLLEQTIKILFDIFVTRIVLFCLKHWIMYHNRDFV